MKKITLYCTSFIFNVEIKKKQQRMQSILESKRYNLEVVDIAKCEGAKDEMRRLVGDEKALPPQLVVDRHYIGGYDEFVTALDDDTLEEFLQIK